MSIPNWFSLFLIAAAAWRTFNLLAYDDIFDRPRRYLLRLGEEWEKEGDPVPSNYRLRTAQFLVCPYCAGFWIGVVWWIAWQIDEKWTEVVAVPWVISAGVIALAKVLTPESEI